MDALVLGSFKRQDASILQRLSGITRGWQRSTFKASDVQSEIGHPWSLDENGQAPLEICRYHLLKMPGLFSRTFESHRKNAHTKNVNPGRISTFGPSPKTPWSLPWLISYLPSTCGYGTRKFDIYDLTLAVGNKLYESALTVLKD